MSTLQTFTRHLEFHAGTSNHLYDKFQFLVSPLVPMGIVKIRHQGAWTTNHERQNSRISKLNDLVEEERLLLKDSDAWGDSELTEMGCELAMVRDQICNIPYELYGLSDMKEILSLETWNSCLTEEERFNLAAYLPDMDQDTFGLTMKELLRGYNLFFGSPLKRFFHGLKCGFYSPHVTRIRDSIQLLHKRRYYHSLRLYHENMAQRFNDMRKTWNNCRPNSTMEERIQIWNDRRDQKHVLLVDLNAFPADEETSSKCDNTVASVPLLKKRKYTNEALKPDTPTITKGKGLLKVRQTHIVQPLSNDTPKGVLKIKPKIDTFGQLERPVITPIPLEHSKWHEEDVLPKIPFLHQRVGDRKTYRSSQCPDESLHMGIGPFDSESLRRKINMVVGTRLHEIGHFPELLKETFHSKKSASCASSADSLEFICRDQERLMTPIQPTVSGANARTSVVGTAKLRMLPHFSDYSEQWQSERVEKDLVFPITYKRKKAHTKVNPTEPKQPPMLMKLKSVDLSRADYHSMEKPKTVKIKVKGWTDYNARYNEGLLKGLQHGSPST